MTLLKNMFLKNDTAKFIMKHGLMVCAVLAVCTIVVTQEALPLNYDTYALYQTAYEMLVGLFGCLIFTVSIAFFTSNPTLQLK